MATPKKPKKITIKSSVQEEANVDDLAKKIDESVNVEVANSSESAKSEPAQIGGAPELDTETPVAPAKKQIKIQEDEVSTAQEVVEQKPDSEKTELEETEAEETVAPEEAPETADESSEDTNMMLAQEANEADALEEDSEQDSEEESELRPFEESASETEPEESESDEGKLSKSVGELASDQSSGSDEEFSDPETVAAIDDIVAEESDQVLEAEDKAREEAEGIIAAKKAPKKPSRIKELFENPAFKWGIIFGVFLLLVAAAFLPASRYGILNAIGVRSSSSITVLDKTTRQPLKNVKVFMQSFSQNTDEKGVVHFDKLKLGKTHIKIEKRGFAAYGKDVVLGWGSNPLASQEIEAVGSIYNFKVKEFPSDVPIASAEATSGESNASANEKGEIRLVVDQYDGDVKVKISSNGYRTEELTFGVQDKADRVISMVPDHPNFFVSNRSGKYDVYQVDTDGKNEKLLLESTGKERDDLQLLAHPTQNYAAFVSTREGNRNRDGYLYSGLYILEAGRTDVSKITEVERIQLVGWLGDYLIFVEVNEGQSAANPSRSRLKSYNLKNNEIKELATANYFNDTTIFGDSVYYAPSSYAVNVDSVKFYRIKPDGSAGATVLDKEVWNTVRTSYNTLAFNQQQVWYDIKTGGSPNKLNGPPASQRTISFFDSPNKSSALWVDNRDGKGVLVQTTVSDQKEKVLVSASGLSLPVRWLSDSVVTYRIVTPAETADYVLSLKGGDPVKITDVSNTGTAESYRY